MVCLECAQTISRGHLVLDLGKPAEPPQMPSTGCVSAGPNSQDRPAKPSLLAVEGGVKTLFPDLSETTLIGRFNSLLSRKNSLLICAGK